MKHILLVVLIVLLGSKNGVAQTDSTAFIPTLPYYYGWGLHPGLNASIDLSVMAQFGKNRRPGAGFGQSLSLSYLKKASSKLWFAVGGNVNNLFWGNDSYQTANLYAALGYKFNEHWEAYIWANKQIHSNYSPLWLYPYSGYESLLAGHGLAGYGDRIGAAVKYNVNPNFSLQLSVEGVKLPQQESPYFYQYRYPVPKP